jgi:uridine kinase
MPSAGLEEAVGRIERARREAPADRAVLVAVSGIDASGKGHVAAQLLSALEARGLRTAPIGIDGWLALPHVRFDPVDPAETFYRRAIRFPELFDTLVLPLRDGRSIRLEADFTEETASAYRKHLWAFTEVDVVLLEGIFLLARARRRHYDLSIWIDCTFETALERAVARAQEGLAPEATATAYETIYFPAQRIHLERDDPKGAASLVLPNDPRLDPSLPGGSGG